MSTNKSSQPFAASVFQAGMAALLLSLSPAAAQNGKEQTAPALPVDLAAITPETTGKPVPPAEPTDSKDAKSASKETVTDYTTQIGSGLKERERRLTLLNEAMMKLREAGEMEDAGRVEERIRALLEMPAPSQMGTKMRAEIEQLRAKNDDLTLQLVALQEELKRSKTSPVPTGTRKGMASNTER
jgi:hypothetical protein